MLIIYRGKSKVVWRLCYNLRMLELQSCGRGCFSSSIVRSARAGDFPVVSTKCPPCRHLSGLWISGLWPPLWNPQGPGMGWASFSPSSPLSVLAGLAHLYHPVSPALPCPFFSWALWSCGNLVAVGVHSPWVLGSRGFYTLMCTFKKLFQLLDFSSFMIDFLSFLSWTYLSCFGIQIA